MLIVSSLGHLEVFSCYILWADFIYFQNQNIVLSYYNILLLVLSVLKKTWFWNCENETVMYLHTRGYQIRMVKIVNILRWTALPFAIPLLKKQVILHSLFCFMEKKLKLRRNKSVVYLFTAWEEKKKKKVKKER